MWGLLDLKPAHVVYSWCRADDCQASSPCRVKSRPGALTGIRAFLMVGGLHRS